MAATAHARAAQKSENPKLPPIPFTHAAHENMEFVDSFTRTLQSSASQISPIDVPARGYVRHLWTRVRGSGGVKGPGTGAEDFPFNVIDSMAFFDVGGGEIFNPLTGYETYLVNKFGGYVFWADPVLHPDFSADAIAFNFALRIPFEISAADALGSLSNQNSQSKYKYKTTIAPDSVIYSTLPTTDPDVTQDIYTELWSQPPGATEGGQPILNRPPLLGTTQYWQKQTFDVASTGRQEIEINRRGNQDRIFILIWRKSDGTRDDATFPDPIRFVWDSREQFEETPQYRRQVMFERYGTPRTALDKGVYVYDLAHDVLGHPGGMDDGHLWYRSKSSSRLEFRGNFGDTGKLTILHNDVAPVAITDQYSDTSGTGGAIAQTVAS
jgi:hypothetical protein